LSPETAGGGMLPRPKRFEIVISVVIWLRHHKNVSNPVRLGDWFIPVVLLPRAI